METNNNGKVKVLITDDHALFRTGVKTSLSHYSDIEFIGEAENGMQLLNMVKFLKPDVILLDIQMPIMDGWCASAYIKDIEPKTQIIAYSSQENPKIKDTSKSDSLDAFCKKDTATPELIKLVRELGKRVANQ